MAKPNNEIIRLEGIFKTFPGVQALADVDFCLKKGEIHALVGENGAGKSTLIKVMTGVERYDKGKIVYDGKEIIIRVSPACPAFGHQHGLSGGQSLLESVSS